MPRLLFLSRQYIIKEGSYAVLPLKTPCQNRCVFCRDKSINAPLDKFRDFEPLDKLKLKVRLAAKKGARTVLMTGSDCLNHPWLPEMISYIHSLGLKVRLETPGIKLKDRSFLKNIMDCGADSFYLPIYASTAALHDFIVARQGAFEELRQAMDNLRAAGLRVHLSAIILKQNYLHLDPLLRFMHRNYPGFFFKLRHLRPFSDSLLTYRSFMPGYGALIPALKSALALHRKLYFKSDDFLKRFSFFIGDILFSLPVCVLAKVEPGLLRYTRTLSEEKTVSRIFSFSRRLKMDFCQRCSAANICGGIDSVYARSYGVNEFAGLAKKK